MKGVLIGAGYFAQFQAEAWKRLEEQSQRRLDFRAVADLAPGKAQEFAAKHGIPRAYESVEAMFEREKPDFVDIATRPESHLPLTGLAASRGIHVICQKPMAPTMPECAAMCDACKKPGTRLLIHENWRWQPWYREAKRIIDTGTLGRLTHLSFDWRTGEGNGPTPYPTQPYFREMPHLLIYETLVHILDTFRLLAGEMRVTECTTRRMNPVIVGEDWAEIRIAFDTGASGFIHGDRQTGPVPAPIAMGSMTIDGERASLRMADDGCLFIRKAGAANEEKLPFTPPAWGYKGDSVLATQLHLLDCLVTGQPSESEGREYLKTVALVEDCYRLAPTPTSPET
jgi:predicted dehydrogenase